MRSRQLRLLEDDLEIEPIKSEIQDGDNTPLVYDISIYPADYTLEVLYNKWHAQDIRAPKFQRDFVWSRSQSSRLIESFMMGLPIPPIFLYEQPDHTFLIIDGWQRLQSVFFFFDGLFKEAQTGIRPTFRLEGINEQSKWFRKKFEEFEDADKRKFKQCVLRCIIVKQLDPKDNTSIYHIFERLNTGGTSLQDQEVRNCVCAGGLNDLLLELNKYPNWRKILGKPTIDSRQKDVQLILRYMALFYGGDTYQKPMKDFLTNFMMTNRNPSEEFVKTEQRRFRDTCDEIIDLLGKRPFNPHGALNASVFDGVFTAFAKNRSYGRSAPTNVKLRYSKLKAMDDFSKLTNAATTDVDTVKKRLDLAFNVLFG